MDICDIQVDLCEGSQLPKYRQLAVGLEQLLLSGAIGSGERLPSDRELAEHLGTTTVTVSKGLNELVSRGLLRRKVGSGTYAGDLSEPACRRIGVVCHEVVMPDRAYISPLLHNFHRYWEEKNYQVLTLRGRPENYLQLYQEFRLAGILVLVPREEFFPDIARLRADGLPLVSIGFACPDLPRISFGARQEDRRRAVEYLYSWDTDASALFIQRTQLNIIHLRAIKGTGVAAGAPDGAGTGETRVHGRRPDRAAQQTGTTQRAAGQRSAQHHRHLQCLAANQSQDSRRPVHRGLR